MSCDICFNNYDHSIHKPYMLSCPHTFCLSCINKLSNKKCPNCSISISVKNPNIALLEFIKESIYDKMKAESQKTLNEINELKKTLTDKREVKLNEYVAKINEIKMHISNESKKFISLVKASELNLVNELTELEKKMRKRLSLSKEDSVMTKSLLLSKQFVENNSLNEEQLTKLTQETLSIKTKLNELGIQIEAFKENLEFTDYTNVSMKDGLIGELKTNQKEFEKSIRLAIESKEKQEFHKAIEYLDKAIEICPCIVSKRPIKKRFLQPYKLKARVFYMMGNYDDSADFYQKCIEIEPNEFDFHAKKANSFFNLGKYDQAMLAINKSLDLNANDSLMIDLKSSALIKLGRYNEALSECDGFIKLKPKNHSIFRKKGDIYMELNNYLEALNCYTKSLQLDTKLSKNSEYLTLKGKALKQLGKIDASIKCFDEAIKSNTKYAPAYFSKAEYFFEIKDYESALNMIDKACEINPVDVSYIALKNKVQKDSSEVGRRKSKRTRKA